MTTAILEGIWIGDTTTYYKEKAESGWKYLRPLYQLGSIHNALYIGEKALLASGTLATISWPLSATLYLSPLIFGYCALTIKKETQPKLHRVVEVIKTNINTICQAAIATSAVVLTLFGHVLLGSIVLAFLVMHVAKKRGWFAPERHIFSEKVGFVGTNIARLTLGSFPHQLLALCSITKALFKKGIEALYHAIQNHWDIEPDFEDDV